MARICAVCGKGKQVGHTRKLLRGHYNVTGNRTFKPNLQSTRVDGHKVLACVKCIKTITKNEKARAAVK